jgi:long-chain acyl-CoA synthetase
MVYGLENEDDKVDVTLSIKVVYDDEYIKEKYSDKTDEELDKILWEQIKEINKGFPRYKHIQNMTTTHTELIKTTTKKIKRFEEMKLIKEGK